MLEEFNVFNFLIAFFGFFVIITIVVLVFTVYMARLKNKSKKETSDDEVVREKETIREIVMVPCQYCGTLIPSTALTCSNCGAGRKA
jgi:heme/copper-type cytochrome/quinol oxidase subunit 2